MAQFLSKKWMKKILHKRMDKTERNSGDRCCFWFKRQKLWIWKKSINNNVSISGHRKATLLENGCCSSIQSRCSGRKCASWPVNGLLYAIKKNKKQVGFSAKTKLWGRTLGSHKRSTDQQSTVWRARWSYQELGSVSSVQTQLTALNTWQEGNKMQKLCNAATLSEKELKLKACSIHTPHWFSVLLDGECLS